MTDKKITYPIPFIFFESYTKALMRIPDRAQRAELCLCFVEYASLGIEPEFGSNWALASNFDLARPNMDSSVRNYLNGKKGGRPRKQAEPKMEAGALADAMAICYEQIPDEVLDAQAAYMSEEHEREREALRQMAEAEAWIG